MKNISDFIYEIGVLRRVKRSPVLNIFDQTDSVADHTFRTAHIALYLAKKETLNIEKVLLYALTHDITEVRCGDSYNIQKKYINRDEKSATEDLSEGLGEFGELIKETLEEYEKRESPESKLVKDADILELEATLLEHAHNGSKYSQKYLDIERTSARLTFDSSKELLKELHSTAPDNFITEILKQKKS